LVVQLQSFQLELETNLESEFLAPEKFRDLIDKNKPFMEETIDWLHFDTKRKNLPVKNLR
jgi:hypothetical protein